MYLFPTNPEAFTAITFKKKYFLLLSAVGSSHVADMIHSTIHGKDSRSMLAILYEDDYSDNEEGENMSFKYPNFKSTSEPLNYCHGISVKDLAFSSEELYFKDRYTALYNHVTSETEVLQLSFPFDSTGKLKTKIDSPEVYSDDERNEDYRYKEY